MEIKSETGLTALCAPNVVGTYLLETRVGTRTTSNTVTYKVEFPYSRVNKTTHMARNPGPARRGR